MGTRGVIGFYKNGVTKVTYNHFDSYPEETGKNILKELRYFIIQQLDIEKIKKNFYKIKLIKDSEKQPTKEEIKKYKKFCNTSVGSQGMNNKDIKTYYQLLRNLQGTLKSYLDGEVNLMIDSKEFLKDSLFCEWGYIVNLDKEVFEVYKGFQTKPQKNRYYTKEAKDSQGEYYNCALVKEYSLNNLPNENDFINDLRED